MNNKLQDFLKNLVPFLMIGVAISIAIWLFIMFSYVLVWGFFIGGILWIFFFLKDLFFPGEKPSANLPKKTKGRIIEHDDRN